MTISSEVLLSRILEVMKSELKPIMIEDKATNKNVCKFEGYDVQQLFDEFEANKIIFENNVDIALLKVSQNVEDYNYALLPYHSHWQLDEEQFALLKKVSARYERR